MTGSVRQCRSFFAVSTYCLSPAYTIAFLHIRDDDKAGESECRNGLSCSIFSTSARFGIVITYRILTWPIWVFWGVSWIVQWPVAAWTRIRSSSPPVSATRVHSLSVCRSCYQKSHKREVLKSYWNHVRFRLKSKYVGILGACEDQRVNYPSLSELSNSDSSLSNLLERESALFFHSTTIFICKEAKESMMELLDSDSWDDQMVVQLFKYARGVR